MNEYFRTTKIVRRRDWENFTLLLDRTKDGFVEVSEPISRKKWRVTVASVDRNDIQMVRNEWSSAQDRAEK